ncbi:cupredoxin domain-containing protein [Nonomuraea angiospora]|uniref:cupredoxin domain-containing protein n=1 Tax=Nonomuraea angiospora TaxID=46172 RepID=UPI003425B586
MRSCPRARPRRRFQESEAAYDREIEIEATDFALEGLTGFTAKAGEKIEFKLENKGKAEHELEIFGPDGSEVGEVSPVKPGSTGEAIVTLSAPGTYTYKCGIADHADHGMKGTFTVT